MFGAFVEHGDQVEKIRPRVKRLATAQGHALMYGGSGRVAIWRLNGDGKRLARVQVRHRGVLRFTDDFPHLQ